MIDNVNDRQRRIMDFIQAEITAKGYPPSIREIGKAVGLQSTAAVANQLRALEGKRLIRRDPSKPRAIEVIGRNGGKGADETNPLPFPCFDSVDAFLDGTKGAGKPPGDGRMRLQGKALVRVNGNRFPGLGVRDGDYLLVAEPHGMKQADPVLFRANGGACRFGRVRETGKKHVVIERRKASAVPLGDLLGKISAVIRKFE